MTKPTRLQRYTVRLGHDVNGIRPVMIPDRKGEWLNQNDVAHQLHVLELHVKELTADLASEATCREAETHFEPHNVASAHAVIASLRNPTEELLARGVATAAGVAPSLVDYDQVKHADLRSDLRAAVGDMTELAIEIQGYPAAEFEAMGIRMGETPAPHLILQSARNTCDPKRRGEFYDLAEVKAWDSCLEMVCQLLTQNGIGWERRS